MANERLFNEREKDFGEDDRILFGDLERRPRKASYVLADLEKEYEEREVVASILRRRV